MHFLLLNTGYTSGLTSFTYIFFLRADGFLIIPWYAELAQLPWVIAVGSYCEIVLTFRIAMINVAGIGSCGGIGQATAVDQQNAKSNIDPQHNARC